MTNTTNKFVYMKYIQGHSARHQNIGLNPKFLFNIL